MSRLVLFFFALLFLSSRSILGQVGDCEQTLNTAAAEYDAGRFYGLPTILKECLSNGFSKEQKVRAYLLLTQAYLILDDPKSAERSYLELLKADPEYIATPERTPIEVYYLSKKFTSTPVLTPNFRLGLNTSIPRIIFSTTTSSVLNEFSSKNVLKIGYQLGGDLDLNLNSRFSIGFGVAYSRKTFRTSQSDNNSGDQKSFIEKEDWFDIPIYLKYAKDSGKIRPFVYAGLAANFLVHTKLAAPSETDFNAPLPKTQQVSQGQDEDITYKRNHFNRSVVIGAGVKYKIGKDFLFVDARYMMGLSNLAKNNYTLADGTFDPILARYGYSSDFFRLDNVSLSFGYIKPLYNPRKKKNGVSWVLRKLGLKRSNK